MKINGFGLYVYFGTSSSLMAQSAAWRVAKDAGGISRSQHNELDKMLNDRF